MYKRCINDKVDGLTLNKIYYIDENNIKIGVDSIPRYWILDDYNVYNQFRADRFIDTKEYKFELWHCLNLDGSDLDEQAIKILESLDCLYSKYAIDDEGFLKVYLTVFDIKEIIDLSIALDDDIVIYGCDNEYLMTKNTMNQLGLS
jgi:hypothetical protein